MTLDLNYYEQDDWFKDRVQQTWSSSYLNSLDKCKRYYFYTVLEKWKPKRESIDLTFGKIFSAAVEMYYRRYLEGIDPEVCLSETVEAVMIESKKHGVFRTEELKTRKALIRALIDYFDTYSKLDGPYITKVEQIFHLPMTDKITFVGKFDIVKEQDGEYKLMDQKTTKSTLSPTYFDTFTPGNQVSMYLYAGRMIFPLPVHHIVIDGVQIMKTGTKFLRGIVSRTKNQLDEWAGGTLQKIEGAWRNDPSDEAEWPQNPPACGYFRGCEFRKVCSADPKMRQAYLKDEFTKGQDDDCSNKD